MCEVRVFIYICVYNLLNYLINLSICFFCQDIFHLSMPYFANYKQGRTKVVEEVAERRFRCLLLRFCFDCRKMTYLMNNSHTSCFIEMADMYSLQKYAIYVQYSSASSSTTTQ